VLTVLGTPEAAFVAGLLQHCNSLGRHTGLCADVLIFMVNELFINLSEGK